MIFGTEEEMMQFGADLAETLDFPCVIELVGDVGTGKTTITKGIARGLGVAEEVTSPSFTLSKRYEFKRGEEVYQLVHYDFYRLSEPGVLAEDLMENIADGKTVTVVEWGDSVAELLPEGHLKFEIRLLDDGKREVVRA